MKAEATKNTAGAAGRAKARPRKPVGAKKHRTKAKARKRLQAPDGCRLAVTVEERQGGSTDRSEVGVAVGSGGTGRQRAIAPTPETARILASVGHPARLRILWLLLKGPAVYRAVQRATKLLPGPLYHHIGQLRLAGLIRPKQRDLYELTRGGRNVVLVAAALNKLAKDRRPRPIPVD